jgi:hypothetical protein
LNADPELHKNTYCHRADVICSNPDYKKSTADKKPRIKIPTRTSQSAAPIVEKTAPAAEKSAPAAEKSAPIVEKTAAPVVEKSTPVVDNHDIEDKRAKRMERIRRARELRQAQLQ